MNIFKWKKKTISLQVDEDLCSGCGNCVIRCRRNVFTLMSDKDRYLSIVINPGSCKGCGHCRQVCSTDAISIEIKNNKEYA
ncbi:MAG: 4Fe-4S binding protein [Tannerellaceae bacterium]|nr:4Fe-4S binding protein [Tannerellaceae bacterium]